MTNKLSNESRYRTDLQKSIAFLHTNNIRETEYKYTPIHNNLRENKIPKINLTKEVKVIYDETFKPLDREWKILENRKTFHVC